MELVFFSTAFICGFLLQQIKLPPLIGFLAAGFMLNLGGFTSTKLLEDVASLGITLLLFTIGLKLQLSNLSKVHVWAPATIHIMISSMLFSGFMMLMATLGLPLFIDLSLETSILLGFAFSFSSTVFAVKVLEQRGEMNSLHGRVSIGILVMQDIFAVLFLNNQHQVIKFERLFYGTIDAAAVYPRIVVEHALKHHAAAVILAHNHPSGIAEASTADKQITIRLEKALALIDVRVLDHIIVAGHQCYSFAEHNEL